MPLYEYKCKECNSKFEVLHKSADKLADVTCPECHSSNNKKLFSTFSASVASGSDVSAGNCASGNCSIPESNYPGGCASGMCGLN